MSILQEILKPENTQAGEITFKQGRVLYQFTRLKFWQPERLPCPTSKQAFLIIAGCCEYFKDKNTDLGNEIVEAIQHWFPEFGNLSDLHPRASHSEDPAPAPSNSGSGSGSGSGGKKGWGGKKRNAPAPAPEQEPAPAPAPEQEPAPAPAPEQEPAPAPAPAPKPKHPDFLETFSKVLIVIVVLLSLVMAATIIFPDFKFYLEYLYI